MQRRGSSVLLFTYSNYFCGAQLFPLPYSNTAMGCASLRFVGRVVRNGFYIEILATTANFFSSTFQQPLFSLPWPPSPLSFSHSDWHMFNHSPSAPSVTLTEDSSFPSFIARHLTKNGIVGAEDATAINLPCDVDPAHRRSVIS